MSDFNLGTVTAYGYAKDKGYTGTEAEFAELMASYADVAEQAAESATQAAASATTATAKASEAAQSATAAASSKTAAETAQGGAETAATTATTKAGEASASATTASGKATEATTAAGTATTKASEATTAATTATTKAGEASTSATNAAASATRAQEILDSIPADYSQMSEDVADLKDGLQTVHTDLAQTTAEALSAYVTDTASGAIASFPNGADGVPVKSLKVAIEPVQDLHGQDAPYPAGGGKNLLDASKIVFENHESDTTRNGITLTKNSDGSFKLSGTATAETRLTFKPDMTLASGSYTLSITGGTGSALRFISNGRNGLDYTSEFLNGTFTKTYTVTDNAEYQYMYLDVQNGATVNSTIYVQLEKGSSATAWSPYENICPISGHTQAVVTRTGKNLFDFKSDYSDWSDGYLRGDNGLPSGTAAVAPAYERTSPFIPIKGGLPFTFSFTNISSATISNNMCFYDADKNFVGTRIVDGAHFYITGTAPDNAAYVRVSARTFNGMSNVQLEVGSTATAYEPYNSQTYTIDLDSTRYGGTLNVETGVLTVTHAYYQFTGSETINGSATNAYINTSAFPTPMIAGTWYTDAKTVCDSLPKTNVGKGIRFGADNRTIYFYDLPDIVPAITDKASLDAWIASQKPCITYPIEAFEVTLTANEISTLLGQNNVWSDAGDVEVEYRADTKLYIQKVLNA